MNRFALLRISCTVAAAIACGAPGQAAAGAAVLVRAVVLKYARVTVLSQPGSVVVTPADIGRGYIDCPEPIELAVQSNSSDGYLLEFASGAEFAAGTSVNGLNQPLQFGTAGAGSVQPGYAPGATRVLKLAYRFELAPGAQAGVYPWPVRVSVTPL